MRELVVEGQKITIIPRDYKFANSGVVTSVRAGDFTLELEFQPDGILENTYCEFYTQTSHGKLYFDSYAKEISGNNLVIASPAKHKFLQRRQYTRIKYVNELVISSGDNSIKILSLDISAGGMKFKTTNSLNIDDVYSIDLQLLDDNKINCKFSPIRIEKSDKDGYVISGQFEYKANSDRMAVAQYCTKRSIEIKNK